MDDARELLRKASILSLLELAPVDWEKAVDKLTTSQRNEAAKELEFLSLRAAELSQYLVERHGYGCGDQGHKAGMRRANKRGKIVWMKAFGYNGYHGLTI
jgi:hypothetical protein